MRLLAKLGLGLLLAAGGAALGFWLYLHLVVRLTLTDQPGHVLLPPQARAIAEATNKITIKLDGYIDATVPFKQTLDLPLQGNYDADVKLDTSVPIRMVIRYRGVVPVDTYADIEGTTDFTYQKLKRLRNVKFKARIPLRFEQPVSFTVPVDTSIRLNYRGPLKLALNQRIRAPVDTVLETRLKAVREITTPILARFGMNVRFPQEPLPVIVKHADLGLRIKGLRLERRPQAGAEPPPSEAKGGES
jgi:hypothetical protein